MQLVSKMLNAIKELQNPDQKQSQQNLPGKFPSGPTGIPHRLIGFNR